MQALRGIFEKRLNSLDPLLADKEGDVVITPGDVNTACNNEMKMISNVELMLHIQCSTCRMLFQAFNNRGWYNDQSKIISVKGAYEAYCECLDHLKLNKEVSVTLDAVSTCIHDLISCKLMTNVESAAYGSGVRRKSSLKHGEV